MSGEDLVAQMGLDAKPFKDGLGQAHAMATSFGRGLSTTIGGSARSIFAPITTAVTGALSFGYAIKQAGDQLGAEKRFSAALKTTGMDARMAAKDVFEI